MSNIVMVASLMVAGFGAEGTVVPSGELVFSHTSFSDDGSYSVLSLAPEINYFLVENFAVGAGISFGFGVAPGYSSYNYGARPTLAYYLPVSETFGLFPKIGLDYSVTKFDAGITVLGAGPGDEQTYKYLTLEVSAPLLFHHESFFLGFGPQFSKELRNGGASYSLAFASTFGGWF